MKNKVTPQIIEEAKAIGRSTYINGQGQVPATCKELMELIGSLELKVGEGAVEIMTAFSSGWHTECSRVFWATA